MADPEEAPEDKPEKRSRKPLLVGLALMALAAGGGFYATYNGLFLAGHGEEKAATAVVPDALPEIAFVPVEPLVISLGPSAGERFLHFTSQIEVEKKYEADVALLLPRILDVLNGYLRAIDQRELEDPVALVRLRAQMLRRIQIVTGEGRARDLLITEFILN